MKLFDYLNREMDSVFGEFFKEDHPKIKALHSEYQEEKSALEKRFNEKLKELKKELQEEDEGNIVQDVALQAQSGVAKIRSTSVKVINDVREEIEVNYDRNEDADHILVSIVRDGESSDLHIPLDKASEFRLTNKK